MQRSIYILVIFIFITGILAAQDYSYTTFIEPSAINRALGIGTGVVDIWHDSPLMSWANPAIPAMHEGISYGMMNSDLPSNLSFSPPHFYRASLASLASTGLALTLPAPCADGHNGIVLDYGKIYSNPYIHHLYYNNTFHGYAFNPFPLLRIVCPSEPVLQCVNIAGGINYSRDESHNANHELSLYDVRNQGLIVALNLTQLKPLKLEAVAGFSRIDVRRDFGAEEVLVDDAYGRSRGFAASVSLQMPQRLPLPLRRSLVFSENLASVRYLLAETLQPYSMFYGNDMESALSQGCEMGLLDTFYYRVGYVKNDITSISGNTHGYGINLHYRNLVSASYNHSYSPRTYTDNREANDWNVNLNLMGIYQKYISEH